MDDAGRHSGHVEGEGGHREEEVNRAAPDAEHGGERADDDKGPEQVAWLLARDHGDRHSGDGGPDQHECRRQRGHRAQPAQQPARPQAV